MDSLSESDDKVDWFESSNVKQPSINLTNTMNPKLPELASKWFYKDPQGDTQGTYLDACGVCFGNF